uniref:Uncharacterized protein n=1 Tax=Romanomermis culicivorax TaxID=13658 RepID=A0A915L201_ROMCU
MLIPYHRYHGYFVTKYTLDLQKRVGFRIDDAKTGPIHKILGVRMNCGNKGATSLWQNRPRRPIPALREGFQDGKP